MQGSKKDRGKDCSPYSYFQGPMHDCCSGQRCARLAHIPYRKEESCPAKAMEARFPMGAEVMSRPVFKLGM